MSTLDDIQDLAATLHSRREGWDLVPTLNYLIPHRAVPIEQLWPAAVAWAENPKNRTPASLQYLKIEPRQSSESSSSPRKTTSTDVCVCGERHERRPKVIDEPPVDSPDRAAAKARARQAIQFARQRASYVPDPPPADPPGCTGCDGTLSRDEIHTHPGCAPAQQETSTA